MDWNDLHDSLFSTAEMSDNCVSTVQVRITHAFYGLIFPIRTPGEIMSFSVSPVNYSDSFFLSFLQSRSISDLSPQVWVGG